MTAGYEPDDIDRFFDQAIKDGRRDDVCKHWWDVAKLHLNLFEPVRLWPSIDILIEAAKEALCDTPTVADLTPREYERLCNAVDALRCGVDEFGDAWKAVERNMAIPDSSEETNCDGT
jgi:hypothetical protein